VIAIARAEAVRVGAERRGPPVPLEECDEATIASALSAPATAFDGVEKYVGLAAKAAALTYALAKSQACIDGNKRVAFLLLSEFLSLNGSDLRVETDEAVDMILNIATSNPADRDMTVLELSRWFDLHIEECAD
jgi:death-on-curing protein